MNLWIARDKSGLLFLYEGRPQRNDRYFYNTPTGNSVKVEESLFPELTWENSPREVELKLKDKEE